MGGGEVIVMNAKKEVGNGSRRKLKKTQKNREGGGVGPQRKKSGRTPPGEGETKI